MFCSLTFFHVFYSFLFFILFLLSFSTLCFHCRFFVVVWVPFVLFWFSFVHFSFNSKQLGRINRRMRRVCRKICKSQALYWTVILLVFLNTLTLASEHYGQKKFLDDLQGKTKTTKTKRDKKCARKNSNILSSKTVPNNRKKAKLLLQQLFFENFYFYFFEI